MPDKRSPAALCEQCDEAECNAQNMTCGRVSKQQIECVNKKCEPNLPGYRCEICLGGKPAYCTDINECEEEPGLCGDGQCTNLDGGYTCTCAQGACSEPQCADTRCGTTSCYQHTEGKFTDVVCGEETAEIVVREMSENMMQLECLAPLYMMLDAWFLGQEKVKRATPNTKTFYIDRTKLKGEVLVTCQLRSTWVRKIARDSIIVTPAQKSQGRGDKKSDRESNRKVDRKSNKKSEQKSSEKRTTKSKKKKNQTAKKSKGKKSKGKKSTDKKDKKNKRNKSKA